MRARCRFTTKVDVTALRPIRRLRLQRGSESCRNDSADGSSAGSLALPIAVNTFRTKRFRPIRLMGVDGWPDPRLAGARRLTVCSDVGLSRFDGSGGVSEIDGVMGVALVATRAPINTAAG
jgi:hypothetical protein